jgi:hypothetical protein
MVFSIICTFVCIFYISKRQKFSEEEKKILFKAYLINGKYSFLFIVFCFFFFCIFCIFSLSSFLANVANRQRMKKNKLVQMILRIKIVLIIRIKNLEVIYLVNNNQNHTGPLSASVGTSNSLFPTLFNKSTVSPMLLSIHEEAIAADIENNNHSNKSSK